MRRLASPSSVLAELEIARLANEREARRGERDAKVAGSYASALSSLVPSLAGAGTKAYDVYGQQQLVDADNLVASNPDVGKDGQPTPNELVAQARAAKEDFDPFGLLSSVYKRRDTHALQGLQARADRNQAEKQKTDALAAKGALAAAELAGTQEAAQQKAGAAAAEAQRKTDDDARKMGAERLRSIVASSPSIEAALAAAAGDPTTGVFNDDDVWAAWEEHAQERALGDEKLRNLQADTKRKLRPPAPRSAMDPATAAAIAEARKRAAEANAKIAEDKAAEGTTGEQKRREAAAASDRLLVNIDKMIAAKKQFSTGALESRAKDWGNALGWKTPGWATFKARTVGELNKYIQKMTGASAGVEEMKRLASVMATPNLDDEEFMELLLLFKEEALAARAEVAATAPAPAAPSAPPSAGDPPVAPDGPYLFGGP